MEAIFRNPQNCSNSAASLRRMGVACPLSELQKWFICGGTNRGNQGREYSTESAYSGSVNLDQIICSHQTRADSESFMMA